MFLKAAIGFSATRYLRKGMHSLWSLQKAGRACHASRGDGKPIWLFKNLRTYDGYHSTTKFIHLQECFG